MKTILFALLILPIFAIGQIKPLPSKFEFPHKVVKDKNEAFVAAKKWIAISYNDYNSIVKSEDQKGGYIIAKPTDSKEIGMFSRFNYTMEIDVKDSTMTVSFFQISCVMPGYIEYGISETEIPYIKLSQELINPLCD